MSKLFLEEITIRGLVFASDKKKACEDVLQSTFEDVPLGNILDHKVTMKAKNVGEMKITDVEGLDIEGLDTSDV